jgi:predicted transcriptional regulator
MMASGGGSSGTGVTTPEASGQETATLEQTVRIVAAYLANPNSRIQQEDLPGLIHRIHTSLAGLCRPVGRTDGGPATATGTVSPVRSGAELPGAELPDARAGLSDSDGMPLLPAVPIRDAVRADAVVCLICGRECKALRGHLTRTHGVDEELYLRHFGLPRGFPLVAPSYSAERRRQSLGDPEAGG